MKAFYINLDKDTLKKKHMEDLFFDIFDLHRFAAVDGKTLSSRPYHMNSMMQGCLLSHKALWQQCADGDEQIIVLEDDCKIAAVTPDKEAFAKQLTHCISTVPSDFDVAMLGFSLSDVSGEVVLSSFIQPMARRRKLERVNKEWFIPGYVAGAHAYLLSPKGAQKLVKNNDIFHADLVLSRDTSLNLYCVAKSVINQKQIGSIKYSNTTVEWLLMEPVIAIGSMTIRVYQVVLVYIASLVYLRGLYRKVAIGVPLSMIIRTLLLTQG